jgi:nucleoside 2-deoxyribosyltransferase
MQNYRVYLSGGMSGLNFKEQTKWRKQFKDAIKLENHWHNRNVSFFDPTEHYNFEYKEQKYEKEPFNYDLYQLRNSDLVIVNFNKPDSLGTAMELMLAYELRIPIIGLCEDDVELHPWLVECCTRICTDMNELINHVVNFYLND